AVADEELGGFVEMALLDDPREGSHRPTAESTADPVVHRVPEDGGDQQDGGGDPDIEAGRGIGRDGADGEQQRISGKERGDDETGFGEDDQEKQQINQSPIVTGELIEMVLEVEDE